MKNWWLTACVAGVVLFGMGCQRDSGDERAHGFDANVDAVASPPAAEINPDILADQRDVSRRAKEAPVAAPSAPPSAATGPATAAPAGPEATSTPARDGNAPPAAVPATTPPATTPPTGGTAAAPVGDSAAPAAATLDPQVKDGVSLTAQAAQASMRNRFNVPVEDFLADADAAAAKPIVDSVRACQDKIKALGPLGQEKAQADVLAFVNQGFSTRPQPWLPGLSWAQAAEAGLKMSMVGDKVLVAAPSGRSATLVKSGDKWKIEYTAGQRDSLKLLGEFFDAEGKYLDAITGDLNGGGMTKDNFAEKVGGFYNTLLKPVLDKANADPELGQAARGGPPSGGPPVGSPTPAGPTRGGPTPGGDQGPMRGPRPGM